MRKATDVSTRGGDGARAIKIGKRYFQRSMWSAKEGDGAKSEWDLQLARMRWTGIADLQPLWQPNRAPPLGCT